MDVFVCNFGATEDKGNNNNKSNLASCKGTEKKIGNKTIFVYSTGLIKIDQHLIKGRP